MKPDPRVDERLNSLEERLKKLEELLLPTGTGSAATSRVKKSSAKEFLMTKEAKTDTQKVLVLGYFIEHVQGMEAFNVSDLGAVFYAAKEKPPTNTNDAVNKNIKRGFLMEVAEKKGGMKAWCLTSTGERYVEGGFKK